MVGVHNDSNQDPQIESNGYYQIIEVLVFSTQRKRPITININGFLKNISTVEFKLPSSTGMIDQPVKNYKNTDSQPCA